VSGSAAAPVSGSAAMPVSGSPTPVSGSGSYSDQALADWPPAGITDPPVAGPFPPQAPGPYGAGFPGVPAGSPVSADPAVPRPSEFVTMPARALIRAVLLTLIGLAGILTGMGLAADGLRLHYDYDYGYEYVTGTDEATAYLLLVTLPGGLLLGAAIGSVGALFRRTRLLIDSTGMRLLTRDPISEYRWKAYAWLVPGVLLMLAPLAFIKFWMSSDEDALALLLPGGAGLLGVLVAVFKLLRIRRRRRSWLSRWRETNGTDPAAAVEVDAHRWADVQAVAVQRVGMTRRRVIVTVPVDRGALTGPAAANRRVMFNGTAFVFADLGSTGMPVRGVKAALHRHGGDRLIDAVGH
jgi:hypothetical protein